MNISKQTIQSIINNVFNVETLEYLCDEKPVARISVFSRFIRNAEALRGLADDFEHDNDVIDDENDEITVRYTIAIKEMRELANLISLK